METPNRDTPQDSSDAEKHIVGLTGMTPESARTFLDFHTGMRWLRPKDA